MRFLYKPQEFEAPAGSPRRFETIFRPIIRATVIGPSGAMEVEGRVDTGADDTLLPESFIPQLGIIPSGFAISSGVGGLIPVRFATVGLELRSKSGQSYRWSARVGFYPGMVPLFGLSGFLEFFTAMFNGAKRQVTLLPNRRLLDAAS